jgi:hypothetical protein
MAADTFAALSVKPFPCETDKLRAFGRTAIHTGRPMRSRPVISPDARDSEVLQDWRDVAPGLLNWNDATAVEQAVFHDLGPLDQQRQWFRPRD